MKATIILWVFVFSVLFFLALGYAFFFLMEKYRSHFEKQIGAGLSDLFLFLDVSHLFWGNQIVAVVLFFITISMLGVFPATVLAILISVIPYMVVAYLRKRRADKIIKQLPEGLSSLAASLRSGLNLVKSLEHLVNHGTNPLAEEFSVVLAEYRMGRDLLDSMAALHQRVKRNELTLLNSALAISRAVGGSLGDTLDSVSGLLRQKAQVEAKIDAMTAMGRAQGWLASLFPFFIGSVFYIQEPEAMSCLFLEPVGWLALAVMGSLILMSVLMIRKIVRIDV